MGEFNSDDHYIYHCGQEILRRNGLALIVTKRVQKAVLRCSLKNQRMISIPFQGKPFDITVIPLYGPASNAEEAEIERTYEDPQWRRQWHPTPVLLPGKPHGRRSLVGCSPWGHTESDTTEVTYQQQKQHEDPQELLGLTTKKDILFIIGDWNAKVES